jgi:hypothetical protein
MDAVEIVIPDAPRPDEVVICVVPPPADDPRTHTETRLMFKAIILLTRNADASPAEFHSWSSTHRLAARLLASARLQRRADGGCDGRRDRSCGSTPRGLEAAYATEIKSVAADCSRT